MTANPSGYRVLIQGPLDNQDSCSAPASLRLLGAAHRGRSALAFPSFIARCILW